MAPATARDTKPGSRWRSPLRSIFYRARKSDSHARNIGRQVAPKTTGSQITSILVSVTSATTIAPTNTTILAKDTLGTDNQLSIEPSRTIDTGSPVPEATTEAPSLALPFQGAVQLPVTTTTTIAETTDLPNELPVSSDGQNDSVSPATTTDAGPSPVSKPDTGIVGGLGPLGAFNTPAVVTSLPEQSIPPMEIITSIPVDSSLIVAIPNVTTTAKTIIPSHPPPSDAPGAPQTTTKLPLTDGPDLEQGTITPSVEPTVAPSTGTANVLLHNAPVSAEQESASSALEDPSSPSDIDTRTPRVLAGGSTQTSALQVHQSLKETLADVYVRIASDSVAPTVSGDEILLPSNLSAPLSSTGSQSAGVAGGLLTTPVIGAGTAASSPTASAKFPGPNDASPPSPKSSNKGTIVAAVVGVMVALAFVLVMILIVRRFRRTQLVKSSFDDAIQAIPVH
ncbi:hypothetical protein EYR38_006393 [Pleurotus pulmonarius]|nr:hypothetical protein EYR38_006393 [Pleurotus pulmonarius]